MWAGHLSTYISLPLFLIYYKWKVCSSKGYAGSGLPGSFALTLSCPYIISRLNCFFSFCGTGGLKWHKPCKNAKDLPVPHKTTIVQMNQDPPSGPETQRRVRALAGGNLPPPLYEVARGNVRTRPIAYIRVLTYLHRPIRR